MILGRTLALSAERYPAAEAVVEGEHRFTYVQWNQRINRLANAFTRLGIRKGDRVLMSLKNREQTAACHWALQKIGGVSTPINWRLASEDVGYIATDAEVSAIVFEDASLESAFATRAAYREVPLLYVGANAPPGSISLAEIIEAEAPEEPDIELEESDLSVLLYTSGTTGRPKGVPRTHRNEYSAAIAHIVQSRNALFDRTLGVMPFYHTMGVRSMLAMVILNGCLVIQVSWDAPEAMSLIAAEKINSLYLVPTLYHDLLTHPGFDPARLASLKKLGYAGAPMSGKVIDQINRALAPEVFVNHLGSTEIYTFAICDRITQKPLCAGRPGIHGRIRVVRAATDNSVGPAEQVRPGDTGELIVSLDSEEAFVGYWNRPDADAKAIRDGWYFTGDLVYKDEDGDIFHVGRVDDMIISGGENIYPIEIEEVLIRHPSVHDVAVIGVPDERLGEKVVCFVVATGTGVTAEELDVFCRETPHLASFKRPREYHVVQELPKSPTGKLLRRELRIPAADG